MRIGLTGGGTGGHFYPLIAVAEAVQDMAIERTLIEPELYYIGPAPFDQMAMQERDIRFLRSPAAGLRRDSSMWNVFALISTAWAVFLSTLQLYSLYPDVIFSTGGHAAFPTLYAARILRIPCVIYDADAKPGRVSLWSSKFARWIGVAHPEAALKFPPKVRDRIARIGHPIRKEIEKPSAEGGYEFLKLDPTRPTIFVIGGSQGARAINEVVLDMLPDLVESYNVIHQAGSANIEEVTGISSVVLKNSAHAERYRPFGLLNALALRMAAGIATIIISRAGSGSIFEIAAWGVPAILVPIPLDVSHDQTENAFSYARVGAAIVIEQHNLAPHILRAEIDRIVNDPAKLAQMSAAAKTFARPEAARKVAQILIETGLEHEPA